MLRTLNCRCMTSLASLAALPPHLHTCDLTGCRGIEDLSPLTRCTALRVLTLCGDYESARQPATLPGIVGALPTLHTLHARSLHWHPSPSSSPAPAPSSCPSATPSAAAADSSDVHATDDARMQGCVEAASEWAAAIRRLTALTTLEISTSCSNPQPVGAAVLGALSPAIAALSPTLKTLKLCFHAISPEGAGALALGLCELINLTSLDLEVGTLLGARGV